jgi:hypothetical protein
MKLSSVRSAVGSTSLLFFAFMGGISRAQNPAPAAPPAPPAPNVFYQRFGPAPMGPDEAMDFVGFEEGVSGQTVTSSPFTATITTESTQVLADGNRIQRKTSSTMARDSQGRTRREMELPSIGPWATAGKPPRTVIINDVVAGKQYVLDTVRKTAREFGPGPGAGGFRFESHSDMSSVEERGNLTVTTMGPGVNDLPVFSVQRMEHGASVTPLGTQTINGITAQGTRMTRTIPAGEIGNEKPIVMTTDRWYSPDLLTVVMTKRTDPLRGDSIRQLTNIQRSEPDASLFQVPSDYTVSQENSKVEVKVRRWRDHEPPPPPEGGPGQPPAPPQN